MGKRGKMTSNDFKTNWDFSERYMPQVKQILSKYAPRFLRIQVAKPEEDMTQAFDLEILANENSKIAVRIRRADILYRDITIRAKNRNAKTEIHKLREGYGDYYLYAWQTGEKIAEYALIDIHKARPLFMQERQIKMNTDGFTGFYIYSIEDFAKVGALIAYETRR